MLAAVQTFIVKCQMHEDQIFSEERSFLSSHYSATLNCALGSRLTKSHCSKSLRNDFAFKAVHSVFLESPGM